MSVTIQVSGGGGVRTQLRAIKRRCDKPEPAWREVGRYMAREVRKQFASRGAYFGTRWAPLAPSTIEDKRRGGWPMSPLVRTGELKREFTGNPLDVERYMGNRAVFGSNSSKALWQHGGTTRNGRQHIPARPILKVTRKMRRDVKKILEDHVKGERR